MATETKSELLEFHQFTADVLRSGIKDISPEECLELWRAQQHELDTSLAAIRRGIEDAKAGRSKPLEQFLRDFRQKHGIPEDV